jgi:hypothetical protein
MPDSVRLSADLFVPDGEGRSAILARTPYDNGRPDRGPRPRARRRLRLVVLQDIHGRFDAEGAYDLPARRRRRVRTRVDRRATVVERRIGMWDPRTAAGSSGRARHGGAAT